MRVPQTSYRLISRSLISLRPDPSAPLRPSRPLVVATARPFTTTWTSLQQSQHTKGPAEAPESSSQEGVTRHPHRQRDAMEDRHQINPESNEYSKSGTDTEAAAQDEAAFNPNITDPHEAKDKAGEGQKVNPLDTSPANKELSQGTGEDIHGTPKRGKN